MSVRYEQIFDGEWESVKMTGEREQCCDCCLVHRVQYRIVKKGKRNEIQMRVWQDRPATAKIRKRAGISVVRCSGYIAKRKTKAKAKPTP